MSYRYTNSGYTARPAGPSLRTLMTALLIGFVVVSLLVFLAGRVPFVPSVTPISGPSYRDYLATDTTLLTTYGRTPQNTIHIPIEQAMDIIAQQGLPTRENPSPTP